MTDAKSPTILVVDDELRAAKGLKKRIGSSAEVLTRTPEAVTQADLRQADLILVDFELHEEMGEVPITQPPNGLALSSVLREQIREMNPRKVTGVALYTGQLQRISGTIPDEVRGFVVARLTNLEWVFEKNANDTEITSVSLAEAIKRLPSSWPEDANEAARHLHRFLGLSRSVPFFAVAEEDIAACHPPVHELSNASHALAVVRWLAQRILPYPAFLMDRIGLAARLRLTPRRLDLLLAGESRLVDALVGVAYDGALAELYGSHWWRAGIDELIFEWSEGTGEAEVLQASIQNLAGRELSFIDGEVVPVIDSSYRADRVAPIESALPVRPDDWPVFADDAWAERVEIEGDPRLRGLLISPDAELVSDA
ncbi:MAG TPA: hypothetical protein VFT30_00470 [Nitrospira sp.]|nr:hypothetical protein [Nitrospira sp.]